MKENQTLLILQDKITSKSFYGKETENKQLTKKMTLENGSAISLTNIYIFVHKKKR